MLLFFIVVFCVFTSQANAQTHTNPVQTDNGLVVGEVLQTIIKSMPYYSFRGIPYAEPPINNLRFQPPEPKKSWQDTLYATSDKERCIQSDKKNVFGTEDCLYLNVYTPTDQTSEPNLKPVIAWIHGGAFTTGYGSSSYYGPDFLMEAGVVVVSMQYRLGPLGFLNVNHPSASGNNGLKDQNLALKWIQRNIRNFGGDPKRVTLLGQSAGGVSVDLHKLSNMSIGLFQQTISMSASPLCKYWAFQSNVEARTQAFLLGSRLGLKTDNEGELLDFLKNASANEIIKRANELPGIPFRPTLENPDVSPDKPKFLTECTPKLYHEGRYNKGPHMMGFTLNEILFLAKSLDELIQYHEEAARSINNNKILKSISFVPKVISTPFKTVASLKKAAFLQLIEELSDIYFVTGIDMKQKLLNKHNNAPVYYYHYIFKSSQSAHKSEGIEFLDGVAHEDELPYIFYRPHVELDLNNSRIATMREKIVKLWTNFVKYGNPTPNGESDTLLGVTWPDSGSNGTHLEINDNLRVGDRPIGPLVEVYQKLGFGDSNIYNDCEKGILNDIINGLVNVPGKTMEVFSDAKKSVGKVSDGISNTKDKVVDGITDTSKKAKEEISDVTNKVSEGISDSTNKVTDVVSDAKKKSIDKAADVITGATKKIPFIG